MKRRTFLGAIAGFLAAPKLRAKRRRVGICAAKGLETTTIQWTEKGGQQINFKVMKIGR